VNVLGIRVQAEKSSRIAIRAQNLKAEDKTLLFSCLRPSGGSSAVGASSGFLTWGSGTALSAAYHNF
jgi:hypothetical protein